MTTMAEPIAHPITYPRDAIVTVEQVAAALQVSVKTVQRMDLPMIPVGRRAYRFLWSQVLDVLERNAAVRQPAGGRVISHHATRNPTRWNASPNAESRKCL